jgi:hypothetical protein
MIFLRAPVTVFVGETGRTSEAGIAPLEYDEIEHVVVMRHFMNDRAGLLAELLREDSA